MPRGPVPEQYRLIRCPATTGARCWYAGCPEAVAYEGQCLMYDDYQPPRPHLQRWALCATHAAGWAIVRQVVLPEASPEAPPPAEPEPPAIDVGAAPALPTRRWRQWARPGGTLTRWRRRG